MPRTRIKFCGITTLQDARAAVNAGADGIGLIFSSASKRQVTVAAAREIVKQLPPLFSVTALFVNATADEILPIVRELGITQVQLHGHEPPALANALALLRITKATRCDRNLEATLASWREVGNLSALLLETASTHAGGSGIPNDWPALAAAKSQGSFNDFPHLIAAGGLTPDSVANVIRELRPYAVDVSSGIESAPGVKSPTLMQAFVTAVRQADAD